jgi:VWFA-related protein
MLKPRAKLTLCTAVLMVLAAGIPAFGQAGQSAPQNDQEPADTLKINVNVVQLFFNVKDKKGGLIPNLTKDQFQIAEDGKPQTIKYFAAESNLPLTLGILIDTSPSQTRVLEMEKEVGGQFLDRVLHEKDLAFVIGFDVDVDLLQDFTSSTRLLKKAMNSTRIGGGGSMSPGMGGGPVPTMSQACCTMLYDAVYLAAHDQLAQQVGRKAMILLTDGEDEGSKVKVQEAIEAAQKSDSICYVLLIADRGGMWQGFGSGEMNKLAKETGGRVIEVGNKFEKLKEGFDQIANELRSQYSVGYTPINDKQDGTFRKIQIQANNKDYKIQARSGYYAVPKRD